MVGKVRFYYSITLFEKGHSVRSYIDDVGNDGRSIMYELGRLAKTGTMVSRRFEGPSGTNMKRVYMEILVYDCWQILSDELRDLELSRLSNRSLEWTKSEIFKS